MQHIHHLVLKGLTPLLASRFRLSKFTGEFGVARLCDNTENALCDARGEFVGPLADRRVADAERPGGCSRRAAE